MVKKTLICLLMASTSYLAAGESLDEALNRASGSGQSTAGTKSSSSSQNLVQELTGDTRLACEAILCLSTGNRPSECNPSIRRYFSIKHRRLHNTIRARHDFLRQCPSSNEQGMPELVQAIANGAGRCDAAELNRINRATYTKRIRETTGRMSDRGWITIEVPYIRNAKPAYCSAYFDHGWTQVGTRYVGEEKNGGRWVD